VGRTANNDIVISDLSVSRFHAFLKRGEDGSFQIQDAGSTNGTVVNDSCVPAQGQGPAVRIKSGDRVKLGQVELTYLSAQAFAEYVRQLEV
jgi:pSer/pThr/pTyr-binding forkhead associated (FHA) protein